MRAIGRDHVLGAYQCLVAGCTIENGRDNSVLVLLERDDLRTEAQFSRRMLLRRGPQDRLKIILGAVAIPNRAYRRGL